MVPKMDKADFELEITKQTLAARGIAFTDVLSCPPPRPDISVTMANGRKVAFEVSQIHADEGSQEIGKGSALRAQEEKFFKSTGEYCPKWVPTRPIAAILHRVSEKCQKHYQLDADQELWLLLAASLPQPGATVAPFLIPPPNVLDLNAHTNDILQSSGFQGVFLYTLLGGGLWEWSRSNQWVEHQAPMGR